MSKCWLSYLDACSAVADASFSTRHVFCSPGPCRHYFAIRTTMFDSWPAQQAPLDVTLKQEPDSADGTSIDPSASNGRAKRTRKPSQRAVEMDVPQLVRQGSGKAVTTAAPSSSGSVPGQSKGRGRQRANPDAPETAQQRAHRKFYLRKKEAVSCCSTTRRAFRM